MELSDLKERLSTCTSREAVLSFAEEVLEGLFIHTRRRAFLLEESPGLPANPVMKAFEEMQTSLHEAQVVDEATWRAYCPQDEPAESLFFYSPLHSFRSSRGQTVAARGRGCRTRQAGKNESGYRGSLNSLRAHGQAPSEVYLQ